MSKSIKKSLFGLLIGFLFLIFLYVLQIYLPFFSKDSMELEFFIKKGDSVSTIANNLKEKGLLQNINLFKGFVWITGNSSNLKSGRYILSKKLSLSDIVERFVKAQTSGMTITIIEGWDKNDVAKYLEEKNICSQQEFLREIKNSNLEVSVLEDKPQKADLEGYMFPDTYKLGSDFDIDYIINKIVMNLDEKLTQEYRNEIAKQKKTIFEIITMASLIEKEVITPVDKAIVSGILWKRIDEGMPLQVDATINYLSGNGVITKDDLKIDSLYNTYKNLGLPPGPISNPGLESIVAAIYPQDSSYWYYLSKPDRTTVFSKTLREHNIARAKYLK